MAALFRSSTGARVGVAALLAAAWALPVAAYAELGRYTRYMADDYCMGYVAQAAGFFGAQRYWYLEWSGRYTYTLLVGLTELFPGGLIPLLPGLVLAAWFAALAWAAAALPLAAEPRLRRVLALLVSGLIITTSLAALPNLTQSLYWRGGALTYVAPLVGGTLLAGVLLRPPAPTPCRWAWYGLIALVAFAGAGFAEVYTAVQGGACGLAFLAALAFAPRGERWRRAGPFLLAALATLAGLLVVALAPGTRIRQADIAASPEVGAILHNSLVYTDWFLRDAAQHTLGPWLAAIAGPALVAWALPAAAPAPRRLGLALALLPLALAALLFAAYATSFYALQYLPPDRVLSIHWYAVMATSAAWGWRAGRRLRQARLGAAVRAWPAPARPALVLIVLVALVALPIAHAAAAQALRPERRYFAANWDSFDQLLRAQPAEAATITVARLDSPAGIDSFSEDPTFWTNHCAGLYYGTAIVAVAPPPAAGAAELATATPSEGQLGDAAQLLAYRVDPADARLGAALTVTLYWQPLARTDRPYTVFIHLLGANGSVAQVDAYPGQGRYPTDRWLIGRAFADSYTLTLPPDAPTGPARLIVGLYDLTTLQRLPATGPTANPQGEAWLELGALTIGP